MLLKERLDLVTSMLIGLQAISENDLSTQWETIVSSLLDIAESELNQRKLVLPDG